MQDPILKWWAGRDGSVPETVEVRSRCVLSFLWIALTLLIAMFVPDISKIISVIGGVSAAFIFIFPGKRSAAEQVIVWFVFATPLNLVLVSCRSVFDICHAVGACVLQDQVRIWFRLQHLCIKVS